MIRFLDPSMFLFCLAAAVPPIVAWLGRRDAVAREWAAMEILARAAGRTAFRRRFVDWLVVAMRSTMLLAVAFAAARPLFVGSEMPTLPPAEEGARERRAVVVGEATAVSAAIESVAAALAPVKVITESQFDDEPFESASLVVLADGVVPGPATARRLGRFVDRGGGVALLVGPRTTAGDAAAFNRFVGNLAGIGVDGVVDRPAAVAVGETVRLVATAGGEAESDLSGPTVSRSARLVIGQGGAGDAAVPHQQAAVLARAMPSGNPLAVRVGVGRGAVGTVAVPLAIGGWSQGAWSMGAWSAVGPPDSPGSTAWTDLPSWPAFLPFVDRTIVSLAAADAGVIGNAGTGIAGWLAGMNIAGSNLAGMALVVAVLLVLLDPLVSQSVGLRSRNR